MLRKRLPELRRNKKITQEVIAKHLSIPRSTYSNYESGKREPDYETLIKLADFFGVTTDYLLGRKLINDFIDFNDDSILDKKFMYKDREIVGRQKDKTVSIIREVLRLELQDDQ